MSKRAGVAALVGAAGLALAGAGVSVAVPPPDESGPARYIVGGQQVSDTAPVVALYADEQGFRCGGVLIAPDTVLTAGHCVAELPTTETAGGIPPRVTETFHVRVGSLDRTAGTVYRVTRVDVHPSFHWSDPAPDPAANGDLAVLHLATPVRNIQPALLSPIQPDRPVDVVGWGYTQAPGPPPAPAPSLPTELQGVPMYAADPSRCHGADPAIGADETCLVSHQALAGPCRGDSGSPGLQGMAVVGLVSRGSQESAVVPCGAGGAVFTDVSAHQSWVIDTITHQRADAAA
ncbi:MAG: S1 family peptidase [Pseudonocardiaceae bacterium]